jgi:hypothetical protein
MPKSLVGFVCGAHERLNFWDPENNIPLTTGARTHPSIFQIKSDLATPKRRPLFSLTPSALSLSLSLFKVQALRYGRRDYGTDDDASFFFK